MKINFKTLNSDDFDEIADRILNRRVLQINNKNYRICEIEFYLHNKNHKDEYVHCAADQFLYGTFYFHKFKNGTYKGGNYKGMDVSFGDANTKTYFGFLIRAIYDIKAKEMIEGPCKVVNKILQELGHDSIMSFTGGENPSIYGDELAVVKKDLTEKEIWVARRIGLSDKYPEFREKKYRYVIYKDLIKREKTRLIKN